MAKTPPRERSRAPAPEEGATERRALDAAEAVFAMRGFAAARIDEIAARAGMAKSHVYYHFDGKQDLLDRLIALRTSEILASKDELLASVSELGPEAIAAFVPRAIDELLAPHRRFLRILLLEGLGEAEAAPVFLRALEPLLADAADRFAAAGLVFDRDQLVSDLFHFGVLPAVLHIVLGERLAEALHVSPARARELFVQRLVDLQTLNVRSMNPPTEGPP